MLVIVGGNSHLVFDILDRFKDEKILLIGRGTNPYIDNHKVSRLKYVWVPTNYESSEGIIENFPEDEEIKFIWLATPFERKLLIQLDSDSIRSQLNQGIFFQIDLVHKVIEFMVKTQKGTFLFIGSTLANLGDQGSIMYSVNKSAQQSLSRGIAVEYARLGIRSNVLELGPLTGGYAKELSDERKAEYLARLPEKKFIDSDAVATTVLSILSNPFLNGSIITLDGAMR